MFDGLLMMFITLEKKKQIWYKAEKWKENEKKEEDSHGFKRKSLQ